MGVLYIAGQKPGAGSTALAASLATAWRKAGRKVALTKPVTMMENDPDAPLFASLTGARDTDPLQVKAVVTGDVLDSAASRVQSLAKDADVVIVEGLPMTGADGAPIEASAALAQRMGAKVIGVQPYSRALGRAEATVWRQAYGESLGGMVVNRRTRYAVHDASTRLSPELAAAGVPALGVLEEDRLLLAPTVRQVAELLNGTFYTGIDEADNLIEHVLIGALITEWGGNYFGRFENQAVMARCGRMDLPMAALNFPLNGLFLTGGCAEPPQYVYQRADYLDVPLITVRHKTQEAVDALGGLHVSIHHPAKVQRAAELVDHAMDWPAVSAMAGLG
ncbi:MAG: DRTGG domain-containing protein [Dehalococcoidia bacterium]